jgi:hypothetical protein
VLPKSGDPIRGPVSWTRNSRGKWEVVVPCGLCSLPVIERVGWRPWELNASVLEKGMEEATQRSGWALESESCILCVGMGAKVSTFRRGPWIFPFSPWGAMLTETEAQVICLMRSMSLSPSLFSPKS